MIGVRADGKKELVALSDGHRESAQSWADLLHDGKRRGMQAPVLAVGDGALGFWAALREVFSGDPRAAGPGANKAMNLLDALPNSVQRAARRALAEIRDAEDREHAERAIASFAALVDVKYPKAVAKVVDADQLLAFYDFPAEHWVHLKTSSPIESTFATVRLRTRVTKGPGRRAAGLAIVFELLEAAQEHCRHTPERTCRAGPGRREIREGSAGGAARTGRC